MRSGQIRVDLDAGKVYRARDNKELGGLDSYGYLGTTIRHNEVDCRFSIHEIIAVASGLNILNKTVNHKDGKKLNNLPCNLEANTHKENVQHGYDSGLIPHKYGELNGRAKLTLAEVTEIKNLWGKGGVTKKEISVMYDVSTTTICNIINGKNWTHGNALIKTKKVS